MRFDSARAVAGMILALCAQTALVGQDKPVSVPFIGCKSDGPSERREASKGTSTSVPITSRAAQALAYYQSAEGLGVLAPRGWYCYGIYGSGGEALFISPQPIDTTNLSPGDGGGFPGPAIEVNYRWGNTSGRFDVAEIIARVFPAYKMFVTNLTDSFQLPANHFTFGPYPKDTLTYRSNRVVEYKTPAQTDGLGTHSWLTKSSNPIQGVAMLVGQTPDLLLLSVRVPSEFSELTSVIVDQVEHEAARSHH